MTGVAIDVTARTSKATRDLLTLKNSVRNIERTASAATDGIKRLGLSIATTLGTAYTAGAINKVSDEFTMMTNRIRLVTGETRDLGKAQRELIAISQRARTDFTATTDVFQRFGIALKDKGTPLEDLLGITETIQKAVIVSSVSSESASSALVQLGQGLAANELRGQELNSIMEQIPRVAQAIAAGMGVGIESLRAMANEGKVTTDAIFEALQDQAEVINREFESMVPTLDQSLLKLRQSFKLFANELLLGGGFADYASNFLMRFSEVFDRMAEDIYVDAAIFVEKIYSLLGDKKRKDANIEAGFHVESDVDTVAVSFGSLEETIASVLYMINQFFVALVSMAKLIYPVIRIFLELGKALWGAIPKPYLIRLLATDMLKFWLDLNGAIRPVIRGFIDMIATSLEISTSVTQWIGPLTHALMDLANFDFRFSKAGAEELAAILHDIADALKFTRTDFSVGRFTKMMTHFKRGIQDVFRYFHLIDDGFIDFRNKASVWTYIFQQISVTTKKFSKEVGKSFYPALAAMEEFGVFIYLVGIALGFVWEKIASIVSPLIDMIPYLDKIKQGFADLFDYIVNGQSSISALSEGLGRLSDITASFSYTIVDGLQDFGLIPESFVKAINVFDDRAHRWARGNILQRTLYGIWLLAKSVAETIGDILTGEGRSETKEFLIEIRTRYENISAKEIFWDVLNSAKDAILIHIGWEVEDKTFKEKFQGVLGSIGEFISDFIKNSPLGLWVEQVRRKFIETRRDMLAVLGLAKEENVIDMTVRWVTEGTVEKLGGSFIDTVSFLNDIDLISDRYAALVTYMDTRPSLIRKVWDNLVNHIVSLISTIWYATYTAVTTIAMTVGTAIFGLILAILTPVLTVAQSIVDAIAGIFSPFTTMISSKLESLAHGLSSFHENLSNFSLIAHKAAVISTLLMLALNGLAQSGIVRSIGFSIAGAAVAPFTIGILAAVVSIRNLINVGSQILVLLTVLSAAFPNVSIIIGNSLALSLISFMEFVKGVGVYLSSLTALSLIEDIGNVFVSLAEVLVSGILTAGKVIADVMSRVMDGTLFDSIRLPTASDVKLQLKGVKKTIQQFLGLKPSEDSSIIEVAIHFTTVGMTKIFGDYFLDSVAFLDSIDLVTKEYSALITLIDDRPTALAQWWYDLFDRIVLTLGHIALYMAGLAESAISSMVSITVAVGRFLQSIVEYLGGLIDVKDTLDYLDNVDMSWISRIGDYLDPSAARIRDFQSALLGIGAIAVLLSPISAVTSALLLLVGSFAAYGTIMKDTSFRGFSLAVEDALREAWMAIYNFSNFVIYRFFEVYDAVIGNSWWTDTIDGIVDQASSLKSRAEPYFNDFRDMVNSVFSDINSRLNLNLEFKHKTGGAWEIGQKSSEEIGRRLLIAAEAFVSKLKDLIAEHVPESLRAALLAVGAVTITLLLPKGNIKFTLIAMLSSLLSSAAEGVVIFVEDYFGEDSWTVMGKRMGVAFTKGIISILANLPVIIGAVLDGVSGFFRAMVESIPLVGALFQILFSISDIFGVSGALGLVGFHLFGGTKGLLSIITNMKLIKKLGEGMYGAGGFGNDKSRKAFLAFKLGLDAKMMKMEKGIASGPNSKYGFIGRWLFGKGAPHIIGMIGLVATATGVLDSFVTNPILKGFLTVGFLGAFLFGTKGVEGLKSSITNVMAFATRALSLETIGSTSFAQFFSPSNRARLMTSMFMGFHNLKSVINPLNIFEGKTDIGKKLFGPKGANVVVEALDTLKFKTEAFLGKFAASSKGGVISRFLWGLSNGPGKTRKDYEGLMKSFSAANAKVFSKPISKFGMVGDMLLGRSGGKGLGLAIKAAIGVGLAALALSAGKAVAETTDKPSSDPWTGVDMTKVNSSEDIAKILTDHREMVPEIDVDAHKSFVSSPYKTTSGVSSGILEFITNNPITTALTALTVAITAKLVPALYNVVAGFAQRRYYEAVARASLDSPYTARQKAVRGGGAVGALGATGASYMAGGDVITTIIATQIGWMVGEGITKSIWPSLSKGLKRAIPRLMTLATGFISGLGLAIAGVLTGVAVYFWDDIMVGAKKFKIWIAKLWSGDPDEDSAANYFMDDRRRSSYRSLVRETGVNIDFTPNFLGLDAEEISTGERRKIDRMLDQYYEMLDKAVEQRGEPGGIDENHVKRIFKFEEKVRRAIAKATEASEESITEYSKRINQAFDEAPVGWVEGFMSFVETNLDKAGILFEVFLVKIERMLNDSFKFTLGLLPFSEEWLAIKFDDAPYLDKLKKFRERYNAIVNKFSKEPTEVSIELQQEIDLYQRNYKDLLPEKSRDRYDAAINNIMTKEREKERARRNSQSFWSIGTNEEDPYVLEREASLKVAFEEALVVLKELNAEGLKLEKISDFSKRFSGLFRTLKDVDYELDNTAIGLMSDIEYETYASTVELLAEIKKEQAIGYSNPEGYRVSVLKERYIGADLKRQEEMSLRKTFSDVDNTMYGLENIDVEIPREVFVNKGPEYTSDILTRVEGLDSLRFQVEDPDVKSAIEGGLRDLDIPEWISEEYGVVVTASLRENVNNVYTFLETAKGDLIDDVSAELSSRDSIAVLRTMGVEINAEVIPELSEDKLNEAVKLKFQIDSFMRDDRSLDNIEAIDTINNLQRRLDYILEGVSGEFEDIKIVLPEFEAKYAELYTAEEYRDLVGYGRNIEENEAARVRAISRGVGGEDLEGFSTVNNNVREAAARLDRGRLAEAIANKPDFETPTLASSTQSEMAMLTSAGFDIPTYEDFLIDPRREVKSEIAGEIKILREQLSNPQYVGPNDFIERLSVLLNKVAAMNMEELTTSEKLSIIRSAGADMTDMEFARADINDPNGVLENSVAIDILRKRLDTDRFKDGRDTLKLIDDKLARIAQLNVDNSTMGERIEKANNISDDLNIRRSSLDMLDPALFKELSEALALSELLITNAKRRGDDTSQIEEDNERRNRNAISKFLPSYDAVRPLEEQYELFNRVFKSTGISFKEFARQTKDVRGEFVGASRSILKTTGTLSGFKDTAANTSQNLGELSNSLYVLESSIASKLNETKFGAGTSYIMADIGHEISEGSYGNVSVKDDAMLFSLAGKIRAKKRELEEDLPEDARLAVNETLDRMHDAMERSLEYASRSYDERPAYIAGRNLAQSMVSALESGFSSWIKEGSSFEDFLKAAADTHTNAMIDAFVGGIFEGMSNGVDGWMDKLFFGTGEMLNKLGNSISGGDTASPDTSSFEDYTIDVETTSEDLDKMTAESLKISSNSEFLLSGILKNTGIMAGTAAEGALDKGPDVDFKESSLSGDSFQYNSVYERTGVGDLSYTPDLKFGEDGRMLESGSGSLDSYFSSYEYDPSLPASDELNLGIPKGADLGFDDVTLGDSLDATYATSDDIITSLDNNSESTGNIFREGWNALGRIDAQGFMSIGIGLTSIAAMLGGGSSGSKLSQGLAIASFAVGAYKAFSPASVDPDILEQPGELNYSPVKTTDPYAFLNKASGGLIRGPGTYTSDSIPAMLSNEEFVINARDSIANRELLNHINAGGDPAKFIDVQKFSTGGLASNDPVHDISTSNVVKMRDIRTSDFSKDVSKDVVKVQDTSINNVLEMKDIRTSDFVKDASKDVAEWLYSSPVSYASVRSDSARMHNDIVESVSHKNAAKFANGGYVKGAGTAKSDSIPAWLSNREFVVNAEATKKNLPILQQINEGRDVPRFATGGLVGNPTSSSTASVLSQATNNYGDSDNSRRSEAVFNIEITGDVSKQTRAEIQRMIPQLAAGINAHNYEQGIK